MYIALFLICRIAQKLDHRAAMPLQHGLRGPLQPALTLMMSANNVISRGYVQTSAFFF